MEEKPKVSAVVEERATTIDQATGTHEVMVKGKVKGFGKGFRDYVMKGGKVVAPDIIVNTGQYPEGHAKAGQWAIQIMIEPFDSEEDAATLSERITPKLKGLIQSGPAITPMPASLADKLTNKQ